MVSGAGAQRGLQRGQAPGPPRGGLRGAHPALPPPPGPVAHLRRLLPGVHVHWAQLHRGGPVLFYHWAPDDRDPPAGGPGVCLGEQCDALCLLDLYASGGVCGAAAAGFAPHRRDSGVLGPLRLAPHRHIQRRPHGHYPPPALPRPVLQAVRRRGAERGQILHRRGAVFRHGTAAVPRHGGMVRFGDVHCLPRQFRWDLAPEEVPVGALLRRVPRGDGERGGAGGSRG
mmetsp:Transcript_129077/g.294560  ORF Transcript_129077/g.294560 Transcript_129077/m.294560 type:complete len:228 (+) Transcript_129077:510-1193(+)